MVTSLPELVRPTAFVASKFIKRNIEVKDVSLPDGARRNSLAYSERELIGKFTSWIPSPLLVAFLTSVNGLHY
jgi:hypothetical protein